MANDKLLLKDGLVKLPGCNLIDLNVSDSVKEDIALYETEASANLATDGFFCEKDRFGIYLQKIATEKSPEVAYYPLSHDLTGYAISGNNPNGCYFSSPEKTFSESRLSNAPYLATQNSFVKKTTEVIGTKTWVGRELNQCHCGPLYFGATNIGIVWTLGLHTPGWGIREDFVWLVNALGQNGQLKMSQLPDRTYEVIYADSSVILSSSTDMITFAVVEGEPGLEQCGSNIIVSIIPEEGDTPDSLSFEGSPAYISNLYAYPLNETYSPIVEDYFRNEAKALYMQPSENGTLMSAAQFSEARV